MPEPKTKKITKKILKELKEKEFQEELRKIDEHWARFLEHWGKDGVYYDPEA